MMRVLPPAHSALALRAVLAGAQGVLSGGDAARAALGARLSERLGGGTVTLLDSGTSALRLAIAAVAERGAGRPVALPAWACYDVLSAVLGAGAPFVFYDIDPDTLSPSAASLAQVAAHGVAGIVVVHAFGVPVDIAAVRRALPEGTPVIEDAAQAWGSLVGDRRAGSLGDYAVLSFGRGKGITGGSGGALVRHAQTSMGADAAPASGSGARDVVASLALWMLSPPRLYAIPASLPWLGLGETHYRPPHAVGGMSHAAAATVLASCDAADRAADGRRARAEQLRFAIADSGVLQNVRTGQGTHPGWLRLPALARNAATRDALLVAGRSLGLASSYPRPLASLAAELGVSAAARTGNAGAMELSARLLTLPTHRFVTDDDVRRLTALVTRA